MENNKRPTPLDARKGHNQQVWRNMQVAEALNLRSVRTASVRVHTSETPRNKSDNKAS